MLNRICICLTILFAIGLENAPKLFVARAEEITGDQVVEPPFPLLVREPGTNEAIGPRQAKILTEVKGAEFSESYKECIDLDVGKAAVMLQKGEEVGSWGVLLSDSSLNKLYVYKPFTCDALPLDELQLEGLDYWSTNVNIQAGDVASKKMRVFGLGAMWIHAAKSAKTYNGASELYNATTDLYRLAHSWSLVDETNNLLMKFTFASATFTSDSKSNSTIMEQLNKELNLEVVEITSHETGELLRTIKVISIGHDLIQGEDTVLLEVPVGFGCTIDSDQKQRGNPDQNAANSQGDFWAKYQFSWSKIDIEVMATKIDMATKKREKDALLAEVAHLTTVASAKEYDLLMSKVSSEEAEIATTVQNNLFNVMYKVDAKENSCTMSHIRKPGSARQANQDALLNLKFSNGLELALGQEQLATLFPASTNDFDYSLIRDERRDNSSGKIQRAVLREKTLPDWPMGSSQLTDKIARMVSTYTEEISDDGQAKRTKTDFKSVTIAVFDYPGLSRILEMYVLTPVGHQGPLEMWPHVPQLFDVSQQCFLDNNIMQAGVDYSWLEFHYPLTSGQLDMLKVRQEEVKELIYEKLVSKYALTGARVPRLELTFNPEELVARALVLDLPDFSLLYEPYEDETIVIQGQFYDAELPASDLRHCAEMCLSADRQPRCKSMSYCPGERRSCLLGMRLVNPTSELDPFAQVKGPKQNCTTFSSTKALELLLQTDEFKYRTRNLTALLSDKHYQTFELPRAPHELTLAPGESGLPDRDYEKAVAYYLNRVRAYVAQKGAEAPPLIVAMMIDGQPLILVPSRSLVGSAPLDGSNWRQDNSATTSH